MRKDKSVPRLMFAERREHSRKPDEALARIERLVDGPYIELFARSDRDGWDSWGDQAGMFNQPSLPTDPMAAYLFSLGVV
jgi:N6-adenosine-specific RNA methylase IME4